MGVDWIKLAESQVSANGVTVSVDDKDKPLNKFGENPALPNGAEALVAEMPGTEELETYVEDNSIDSLILTDTNYTGDVYIEGHTKSGSDYTFVTQTIAATGQTRKALTTSLSRVSRTEIRGTLTTPATDKLYIYESDGVTPSGGVPDIDSQVHMIVSGKEYQSLKAATTISSQDYLFITGIYGSVVKNGGGSGKVDFRLKVRAPGSEQFLTKRKFGLNTGQEPFYQPIRPFLIVPANSDVIMTAEASAAGIAVAAGFDALLAKVQS